MTNSAKAEWHKLHSVLVHEPGVEMFYGLLEPNSFLYDRAFDESHAIREHQELVSTLKNDFNVRVVELKTTLLEKEDMIEKLVIKAQNVIEFKGPPSKVKQAKMRLRTYIGSYNPRHFLNILLLKPTVKLTIRGGNTIPSINLRTPLSNLFYMRDQQILTDKGFVIVKPKLPQRRGEQLLSRIALESLNSKIIARVTSPGTFEGGDFIPAGKIAFIGKGKRTNQKGIEQVMNYVSFDKIVVVHNPAHPALGRTDPMVTMHLDTYFNIAGEGLVVGNKQLMGKARIDIWKKVSRNRYEKLNENFFLLDYLKKIHFDVIDITTLEQLCFASNFLCVDDHKILSVDTRRVADVVLEKLRNEANIKPHYKALLQIADKDFKDLSSSGQFFPHKREVAQHDIDYSTVRLENITGGYGSIHCMTCPLNRG
ncbi:MAG: arginine deiminase family protein [Nitrososphaerales archaeon]